MAVSLMATHQGTWSGTNGFRMMPTDRFDVRPASAEVRLASGGHLTTIAYGWEHPTDGPQAGLVAMWATDDRGSTLGAVWSDSWHQQPGVMELAGTVDTGGVAFEATYAETWGWRIVIEGPGEAALRIVMSNVVPAEHATDDNAPGPYEVAVAELTR